MLLDGGDGRLGVFYAGLYRCILAHLTMVSHLHEQRYAFQKPQTQNAKCKTQNQTPSNKNATSQVRSTCMQDSASRPQSAAGSGLPPKHSSALPPPEAEAEACPTDHRLLHSPLAAAAAAAAAAGLLLQAFQKRRGPNCLLPLAMLLPRQRRRRQRTLLLAVESRETWLGIASHPSHRHRHAWKSTVRLEPAFLRWSGEYCSTTGSELTRRWLCRAMSCWAGPPACLCQCRGRIRVVRMRPSRPRPVSVQAAAGFVGSQRFPSCLRSLILAEEEEEEESWVLHESFPVICLG